ncbi:PREDICTED: eukaryotic translation initiation factor 3 subunit K [Ceratosolen solmsi marchali]|uniref:Eukaryotic translation initiation factor 3 subunit K n=1 Tax=Ceratosolen solmsi marchali TaxID=326594 RepID=A0AAJ7E1K1_9HYME|nr:PREDICTED: eukaryotic translation initiation factor 3 subunit K [Ceratosolen solmsi marchali]
MMEAMKQKVTEMLKGIERYNPDNLITLRKYVEVQVNENAYDLDANLAVLKLYQMNPHAFDEEVTCQILLKALTNLPHTDFVLCKCLLNQKIMELPEIANILDLANILEECQFQLAWNQIAKMHDQCSKIVGFNDSIRKFVCHVVGITFQTIHKSVLVELLGGTSHINDATLKLWVKKYGWVEENDNIIFIANQDENIKTKNITEKIDFENVAGLMAACL